MQFLTKFQHDQNIDYFNPSSHLQMQQLLHAPYIVPAVEEKKSISKETKKDFDP